MRIAVLGWGSLVWCPSELDISTGWREGPALPIEFARESKGSRVTLVLVPEYPCKSRVFWLCRHMAISMMRALISTKGKEGLDGVTSTT